MSDTERAYAHWAREGRLPAGYDWRRQTSLEALLGLLREATGIAGPAAAISTACSSSGKVFGSARRWLRAGVADAVLVGGVDCLCELTLRGFFSLAVLSPEPARPFGAERRGINIGEGAAFALVERTGEGPLLLGVGETADAHHMSAPHPEGRGARAAMAAALAQAGLAPEDVDHVNAHGTGTPQNDAAEARAIADLFRGCEPAVVATKAYTGHLLGAAGATEAVFALHAIRAGELPASLGSDPPDASLPVRPLARAERRPVRRALSNSFAFGGSNVAVLFGEAP
jgi:3-oxoacyl-[acyl-carrier-protein] synthase-1